MKLLDMISVKKVYLQREETEHNVDEYIYLHREASEYNIAIDLPLVRAVEYHHPFTLSKNIPLLRSG